MKQAKSAILLAGSLLILYGLPCLLWWLAARQEKMNAELLDAVRIGNTWTVKLLLDNGADPNYRHHYGHPVKDLLFRLRRGTRPFFRNYGMTPLQLAVDLPEENLAIIDALLANGANPNIPNAYICESPMNMALCKKRSATVRALLRHGAFPSEGMCIEY